MPVSSSGLLLPFLRCFSAGRSCALAPLALSAELVHHPFGVSPCSYRSSGVILPLLIHWFEAWCTHTHREVFFFFLIKNKEEFYNVNVRFKMSLLSFKYLLKTFKGLPLHWKRFWSIESLAVENEISQEVDFWKQWLICFHWSQESKITIHSVW